MVKNILSLLLLTLCFNLHSQEDSTNVRQTLDLEVGLLGSSSGALPFWMQNNNSERFTNQQVGSVYSLVHYAGQKELKEWFKPSWEVETVASSGINGSFASIIQANLKVELPIVSIVAGFDEEFFGVNDTLLSIGNLSYGNNARPLPKLRIQTNGWTQAPFLSDIFSFKAYLVHGWFETDRLQSNAFLHQKSIHLRFQFFEKRLSIIGGGNHNAQWAGQNNTTESVQPRGLKNYARIFFGMSGGEDAGQSDQQNALGNHLGTYDIRGSYKFKGFTLSNYWQFLWEDNSGLTPFNWRDGMVGASFKLHKNFWIDRFVIEVVRTNDQDAHKNDGGFIFSEPDNFFNNGAYGSGWTYGDRIMGSPMFIVFDSETNSRNTIQNKVNALNIAIGGNRGKLSYTLKYTEFKNNGTVLRPFETSLKLQSIDLNVGYPLNSTSHLNFRANYQNSNFHNGSSFGFHIAFRKALSF